MLASTFQTIFNAVFSLVRVSSEDQSTVDHSACMNVCQGGPCVALASLHAIVLVWYCMLWSYIIMLHVFSAARYDDRLLAWTRLERPIDTLFYVIFVGFTRGDS